MYIEPKYLRQPVTVKIVRDPESKTAALLEVSTEQREILEELLHQMWVKPEQWHRLQETQLEGRAGRIQESEDALEFEIRTIGGYGNEYRFVYDGLCHELYCWMPLNLNNHSSVPNEDDGSVEWRYTPKNLALAFVSTIHGRPEIVRRYQRFRKISFRETSHQNYKTNFTGPAYFIFNSILKKLSGPWFRRLEKDRNWIWHGMIAFVGSLSLLIPLIYLKRDVVLGWIDTIYMNPESFLGFWLLSILALLVALWFSYPASCITSRRNLHTPCIPRHRLVLRIQGPSRCAQRRERRPCGVWVIVTRCEEDAHLPIAPESPVFMGRASPFARDLCNVRGILA